MTTRAISKKPRSYILKKDRGKEGAPVFTIRSLDIFESTEISETDKITFSGKDGEEPVFNLNMKLMMISLKKQLILGLLGWENLKDINGELVPFSQDNICLLQAEAMNELGEAINGSISEQEEKKSETPSS